MTNQAAPASVYSGGCRQHNPPCLNTPGKSVKLPMCHMLWQGTRQSQGSTSHLQPHRGEAMLQKGERQIPKQGIACMCKSWSSLGLTAQAAGAHRRGGWAHHLLKWLSCFWSTGVTCHPALTTQRVLLAPQCLPSGSHVDFVGNTALDYVLHNFCPGFRVLHWVSPSSWRPPEGAQIKQMKACRRLLIHQLKQWFSFSHL